MNKNRNNVQFTPKKPQIPLTGLSCGVLNAVAPVLRTTSRQKKMPEENLQTEVHCRQYRTNSRENNYVNHKISFDKIDELTRPSAYSESAAEKSEVKMLEKIFEPDTVEPPVLESESGLGTKFVLRNSQEISAAETLPKRFVLNLPEWPQMPEILAAVKEETEQERQRSKWQEALHRYENQKCDTENNTEPQIIPMPESTHHSSTERPSIQHSGSETNNTETENGEQQIHIVHEPVIQNIEPAQRSESELPGMLSVRGLTKSYKKGKLIIPVLCGVDLTIGKGEFVSVAGQSGSGKSTFLHLLGTLDKPDSGSIYLKEQRIDNLPRRQRDNIRNRSIGFIFQFYHLLPELTTLENVLSPLMIRENLWRYMTKRKSFIEQGKDILNLVGLSHRLNHKPNELSGGEMQRAAIARALVASPAVLLADEPTGNLDSKSAGEIIGILQQLNQEQGLTIVMITHDNIIAKAADRMVRMIDGVIVHEETANLEERLLRKKAQQPHNFSS